MVEEPAELSTALRSSSTGWPARDGDRAVWFLVAGGTDELPYHAVVNAQGRYEVVGDTLRPAASTRSPELAGLGLEALGEAVGG